MAEQDAPALLINVPESRPSNQHHSSVAHTQAHSRIANWDAADFRAVATETGVTDIESGETRADKAAVAKVQADDKLTLQAYGRPYRHVMRLSAEMSLTRAQQ
jgi:hypothetical protein